jgi:hypothetical protein
METTAAAVVVLEVLEVKDMKILIPVAEVVDP